MAFGPGERRRGVPLFWQRTQNKVLVRRFFIFSTQFIFRLGTGANMNPGKTGSLLNRPGGRCNTTYQYRRKKTIHSPTEAKDANSKKSSRSGLKNG